MRNLSVPRPLSLVLLFLLATQCALSGNRAFAQKFKNIDASVNVFGQFTGDTSGNGIVDKPSRSMGGLATFRQSFKPWLGYEINYSYTRFSESYSTLPFAVQSNVHEVTGAYLVQAPKLIFFQPFATVGTGWLIFLPTTVGGQHNNMQTRMPLLYELGVNWPLMTNHFGARFEYRGFLYSTPDFNEQNLRTGTRRQTGEPTAGLYIRF